jgi:TonB family protein
MERSLPATKDSKAKTDVQNQVNPDSDLSALNEVVVVGYGTKKSESEKEDVFTGYVPPQPLNGKAEFDKYVQTNLHRPDSTTDSHRIVVVISFLVRTDGSVDSIRIIRSPGKRFSDEAIRVIKSGPYWKPAEDNGKPIEDNVRMRIVFK